MSSPKAEMRARLDTMVLNTVVGNPGLGMKELFEKLPKGMCESTDALRHRISRLYKQGLITRHGKRNFYTWSAAGKSLADAPKPERPSPTSAEAIIDSLPDGPSPEPPPDSAMQELDAMREVHKAMSALPDNGARARVLNWVEGRFNLPRHYFQDD